MMNADLLVVVEGQVVARFALPAPGAALASTLDTWPDASLDTCQAKRESTSRLTRAERDRRRNLVRLAAERVGGQRRLADVSGIDRNRVNRIHRSSDVRDDELDLIEQVLVDHPETPNRIVAEHQELLRRAIDQAGSLPALARLARVSDRVLRHALAGIESMGGQAERSIRRYLGTVDLPPASTWSAAQRLVIDATRRGVTATEIGQACEPALTRDQVGDVVEGKRELGAADVERIRALTKQRRRRT